jgi:hypothetical protein
VAGNRNLRFGLKKAATTAANVLGATVLAYGLVSGVPLVNYMCVQGTWYKVFSDSFDLHGFGVPPLRMDPSMSAPMTRIVAASK